MKRKVEVLAGAVLVGIGGGVAEFYSFRGSHLPVLFGLGTLAAGARISEAGIDTGRIKSRLELFRDDFPVKKVLLSLFGLGLLTQGSVLLGQSIVLEQVVKSFAGASLMFFGFVALHYALKDTMV